MGHQSRLLILRPISPVHMHVLGCLNCIFLLDPVIETELNTQIQTPSDWNHEVQSQLGWEDLASVQGPAMLQLKSETSEKDFLKNDALCNSQFISNRVPRVLVVPLVLQERLVKM